MEKILSYKTQFSTYLPPLAACFQQWTTGWMPYSCKSAWLSRTRNIFHVAVTAVKMHNTQACCSHVYCNVSTFMSPWILTVTNVCRNLQWPRRVNWVACKSLKNKCNDSSIQTATCKCWLQYHINVIILIT